MTNIVKDRAVKNINRSIEVGNIKDAKHLIDAYDSLNLLTKKEKQEFAEKIRKFEPTYGLSVSTTISSTGWVKPVESIDVEQKPKRKSKRRIK